MSNRTIWGLLRWGIPGFGALILVAMWVMGTANMRQDKERTEAEAYRRSDASTQAYEAYILRALQQIDQLEGFIAENAPLTDSDAALTRLLAQALQHQPNLSSLYVTNEHGDIVAVALRDGKATATGSAKDRAYFQVHEEARWRGLYVGEPTLGRVSKSWVIHLSRARFKADGSFAGVVVATVNPGFLVDFYNEAQFGKRGLVSLTGLDWTLRARRSGERVWYGDRAGPASLAPRVETAPAGHYFAESRLDGISRFIAYRVISPYRVVAYTGLARDEVLAEYEARRDRLREFLVFATGVVLLATGALTLLVLRLHASRLRAAAAEDRFQAASDAQLDPFFMLSVKRAESGAPGDFVCEHANPPALHWLARERAQVVGQSALSLVPKDLRPHLREVYETVLLTRGPLEEEFSWHTKQGEVRRVVQQVVPVSDGLAITMRDITQTRAKEELLREQRVALEHNERQLLAITNNVPVLISYVDRDRTIVFVNETHRRWYGSTWQTPVGKKLFEHWSPAVQEERIPYVIRAMGGERVEFLASRETVDGLRTLQSIYVPDVDADGLVQGIYMLSFDITDFKRTEAELSNLLYRDTLTGLDNRLRFNELLPQALARAKRSSKGIALLFLDVDRFKHINDTHGHAIGDDVLKKVAKRLRQVVRETDMVVRLAGDEFILLLEELGGPKESEAVASKVVAQFRTPLSLGTISLPVTVSVGVAYDDGTGLSGKALLQMADEQLYAAKAAGRNAFSAARY
ncbi:bifunctional diguanylate cyclase/phosphodiesterase [Rhodoferax koreense]|nr:diguanylate cyclase [Rhodoferax koreense]